MTYDQASSRSTLKYYTDDWYCIAWRVSTGSFYLRLNTTKNNYYTYWQLLLIQVNYKAQVHLLEAADCPNHSNITPTHHGKDAVKNTKQEDVLVNDSFLLKASNGVLLREIKCYELQQ